MQKSFQEVGWKLLGIVLLVLAVAMFYFAVMSLISGSVIWFILLMVIGIILVVVSTGAFRHRPS